MDLTTELFSLAETALSVAMYFVLGIAIITAYLATGYWLGSPLGTLVVHAASMAGMPVSPAKISEASRMVGAVFSVIFWFAGVGVESARLPHPEAMGAHDFTVLCLRAAIIGIAVTGLFNAVALVARPLWVFLLGGMQSERVKSTQAQEKGSSRKP